MLFATKKHLHWKDAQYSKIWQDWNCWRNIPDLVKLILWAAVYLCTRFIFQCHVSLITVMLSYHAIINRVQPFIWSVPNLVIVEDRPLLINREEWTFPKWYTHSDHCSGSTLTWWLATGCHSKVFLFTGWDVRCSV